ncbi:hypothetical protein DMENIID0001_067620 [Sergentomyia squamirostris]
MDRWVNKVAVVTEASSGIGAEIVKDLARAGMIVVGLARRSDRVKALKSDLPEEKRSNLYAVKCDVTINAQEIVAVFSRIKQDFGGIDVLVNNAGIANMKIKLIDRDSTFKINDIIQTNVVGLINCTREAVASMKERDFPGQIININSVVGHRVLPPLPNVNWIIYPATKFAARALSDLYFQEITQKQLGIKVGNVSPAAVKTDITEELTNLINNNFPHLLPTDISQAVIYILSTPPHVNIQDILIKPVRARN